MADTKTVFIVGAGASAEVDLPVGVELTAEIAEITNLISEQKVAQNGIPSQEQQYRRTIVHHVMELGLDRKETNAYFKAARIIAKNMATAPSIDAFIDSHPGNERVKLCAKLAITQSILAKERDCPLHYQEEAGEYNFDHSDVAKTWYTKLLNILTPGCSKDEIGDRLSKLSFIIFNYDRCVEHYLLHALQNWYDISPVEAASILEPVQFYHPYGQVGLLPWQSAENSVPFGKKNYDSTEHLRIARQIRTFSEQEHDQTEIAAMRNVISEAEGVVILGFSFQPQNINLITPKEFPNTKQILSTALNISESDRNVIKHQLLSFIEPGRRGIEPISFLDKECYEFFGEYHLTLSSYVQ